jgi:TonB family protein
MSLAYPDRQGGSVLWLGLAISLGLHGLLATALFHAPADLPLPKTLGLKGRELIDLAEVDMLMAAPETDLASGSPAEESQAALDSPEKTEIAKTSDDPLLAQIPYKVNDPELQFRLANPDQNPEATKEATEVPTEIKEEPKDKSAPDSTAAAPDASAGQDAASQSDETEEGLSDEETAAITAWQKSLVLTFAEAKTYPKAARAARATGEVVIGFALDRYGRVLKRKITRSSGHSSLDEAALTVIDGFDRLPAPPGSMGPGPFDLSIPFNYRFK